MIVEVVTGGMYAGKSEELIRRLRREQIAKQKVVLLKPLVDTRKQQCHSGITFPFESIDPEVSLYNYKDYNIIGIDEAQFLKTTPQDMEYQLQQLRNKTLITEENDCNAYEWYNPVVKKVIFAFLDLDYRAKPFNDLTQYLLSIADKLDKYSAICVICGKEATKSRRITEDKQIVLVGGGNEYLACCNEHFYMNDREFFSLSDIPFNQRPLNVYKPEESPLKIYCENCVLNVEPILVDGEYLTCPNCYDLIGYREEYETNKYRILQR